MKKKKLDVTPWFDGSQNPAHIGWYRRNYGTYITKDYWDGAKWRFDESGWKCLSQYLPWRGLAKKP